MQKGNIKIVFLDMDGTLLNNESQVSKYNKEIINKLVDKGIRVCLCSGRSYGSMIPHKNMIGLKDDTIAFSGAAIYDGKTDELKHSWPVDKDSTIKIIKMSRDLNATLNFYKGLNLYVEARNENVEHYEKVSGMKAKIANFDDFKNEYSLKLHFVAKPKKLEKIIEVIEESGLLEKLHIAKSSDRFLEVLDKNVSKANAIKYFLKLEKIDFKNVMAFGDNYNDEEMLEIVGHGVIMQNAPDDLKLKFKNKALKNSEDGVGKYLKEFFNL